jgi:Rod binding domain-containing protein
MNASAAMPTLATDPKLGQPIHAPRQATTPAAADKVSRQFEAVFMSQMLQHMFSGIKGDGIFGGGSGEQMFKSMLLDEYGKMIANRGNGIGIADAMRRSLLQGQEVH